MCLICQKKRRETISLLETLGLLKQKHQTICEQCATQFASITLSCSGCGRQQEHNELCYDCCRWQNQGQLLLTHQALYVYNDAMHDYMQRYKFNGEYALRHVFNRQLIQAVQNIEIDLVVPIPVSQYTLLTRGFNQTLGLFEGLRYQQLLSVSQAKKIDQSRFNRQKRLTRAQPFVIANDISLSGQSVLLIDDVYTTGRTLYYAAELIYTLGAKNVKSLSLAR